MRINKLRLNYMIYLDNAATTKPSEKVIEKMVQIQRESWGNPSSIHSAGQSAANVLVESRNTVAEFLNCDPTEVIFTSGGSESDNFAIRGVIEAVVPDLIGNPWIPGSDRCQPEDDKHLLPHVITSQTEHHAVLHTVEDLEKEGKIEATYLKPDKNGVISPESVVKAIRPNTVLVSIMYVNNETGTINPIKEIGLEISNYLISNYSKQIQNSKYQSSNESSRQGSNSNKVFFHTDAVQAAQWLPMDVAELGVDLLTFSGHKIQGPKGVGVLYVKKGTPIKSQITGGGHEFNKRAGTENVAGIAGLAEAVQEIRNTKSEIQNNIQILKDKLGTKIQEKIDNILINGQDAPRSPHILNISFKNAEGESILLNLDFLGIAVSSGSACTSRSLEPSHVLRAMNVPIEYTHGSIRFSLSRDTTEKEIEKVIEVLPGIISKLRQMSPFKS